MDGYVELRRRLHHVEEAQLHDRPLDEIVVQAVEDHMRLSGSTIPKKDELCAHLTRAVRILGPNAVPYLLLDSRTPRDRAAAAPPTDAAPASPTDEALARAILVKVRKAIDDYRDDRRDGLVRARNNLLLTVTVTGALTYAILALTLFRDVSDQAIVALCAFYLVGALVGLFRQLRVASDRDTVVEEDYGLSFARLVHTPLFSGLAAVGGAYLAPTLSGALLTMTTPTSSVETPQLSAIFDLTSNQVGLLVAAVFGLTPNLLILRLQKQAESYKTDLKSSEPAERGHPGEAARGT
jgi:hypothetical protein